MKNEVESGYAVYCAEIRERIANMFIYTGPTHMDGYTEEIRNAALIAMRALEWLATPAETIEIVVRKPHFHSPEYPEP